MARDEVIKSAGRVFAVLELFETEQAPLSATEIERALELPQSSTLALLKSLVTLGYLDFEPLARLYTPSLRLASLGEWVWEAASQERLKDLMAQLSDATGETVAITSPNGLSMQFLALRPGRNPLTLNIKAGTQLPLFGSMVGLVALAQRPDSEIVALAGRINRKGTLIKDRIDLPHIQQQISQIRNVGYGLGYGNYLDTIGAIGLALPRHGRGSQLVLSVAGPLTTIRAREAEIVDTMRAILACHGQIMSGVKA